MVKGAVWSASIGEVEPAGEGEAPLLAVALDGAVGPAAEQGADEALGFAVRARRVGAGAQVFDPRMELTLSCDHRAVDGAQASEFLATIKQLLQQPTLGL